MTAEELKALQDQVPEEYKYFFTLFPYELSINDDEIIPYCTDGKPDLEKMKCYHNEAQSIFRYMDGNKDNISPFDYSPSLEAMKLFRRWYESIHPFPI
jgi:hypothetical protein